MSSLTNLLNKLQRRNARSKTVMAVSLTRNGFYTLHLIPGRDPIAWKEDVEVGVVDENGIVRDVNYVQQLLQRAIQRFGKPDFGIAVVPADFTSMYCYHFDEASDRVDSLLQQYIIEDNPFIITTGDRNFSKEAVAAIRQNFPQKGEKKLDVVVDLFPQKIVDFYQQLLAREEVPLASVGTSTFGLLNVLYNRHLSDDDRENDFAIVSIGNTVSSITICSSGIPSYQRKFGVLVDDLMSAGRSGVRLLIDEIRRSIDHYQKRIDPEFVPSAFYIVGEMEIEKSLGEHFPDADVLTIGRELIDSLDIEIDSKVISPNSIWISLLNSVVQFGVNVPSDALFTHQHVFETSKIDLKEQVQRWAVRYLPHVWIVALLFVGSTWMYQMYVRHSLEKMNSDTDLQVMQLESVKQKQAEINAVRSESQEVVEAINYIDRRIFYYPDMLSFIMDTLIPDVILESLQIQGNQWTARGLALSSDSAIDYIENLEESPYVEHVSFSQITRSPTGFGFDLVVRMKHRGVEHWWRGF